MMRKDILTLVVAFAMFAGIASGQGRDLLIGGSGSDWLSGGTGQDAAGQTIRLPFAVVSNQGQLLIFVDGVPMSFQIG